MLRLARAPNIAIASLWVDLLRQAGFDACLNRYFLGAAAGELHGHTDQQRDQAERDEQHLVAAAAEHQAQLAAQQPGGGAALPRAGGDGRGGQLSERHRSPPR